MACVYGAGLSWVLVTAGRLYIDRAPLGSCPTAVSAAACMGVAALPCPLALGYSLATLFSKHPVPAWTALDASMIMGLVLASPGLVSSGNGLCGPESTMGGGTWAVFLVDSAAGLLLLTSRIAYGRKRIAPPPMLGAYSVADWDRAGGRV